jgi:predicted deacetylase
MEAVRTQRTEGTGGVRSLAEAHQIKKDRARIAQLRKELAEGDVAAIKGYNDRDLEFLAEDERRWRTELSQTVARVQMNMLRNRILKELSRSNLKAIEG